LSNRNLKFPKGAQIAYLGETYKVTSTTSVNVRKCQESPKEEEIKGDHQTDAQPDRTKKISCAIIQKQINKLEQEEHNALFDIGQDDVLFMFDEEDQAPNISVSKQIERTQEITNLKRILKEIKAI
jgi:hypothetical protein